MDQLQVKTKNELSRLDELAQLAQTYAAGATMNMLMLGRVFIEAKSMLNHGEFAKWCDENAGCSIRHAENMMSAYTRFGNRPEFMQIGKSKLFKMLTLPEGTEDQFIEDHDVSSMSSREIDQAIREVRGERKEPDPPKAVIQQDDKMIEEIRALREERDRLTAQNRDMLESKNRLNDELRSIRDGSEYDSKLISDQQATIENLTEELNRYRVAEARGESGRAGDTMDASTFRTAVQEFMGCVHQIPQMGTIFATMDNQDRMIFDTLLKSVEAWTKGAREAIDTIEGRFVE